LHSFPSLPPSVLLALSLSSGQKRKGTILVEELRTAFEERAAEREFRMRKMELEMEAKMRERGVA